MLQCVPEDLYEENLLQELEEEIRLFDLDGNCCSCYYCIIESEEIVFPVVRLLVGMHNNLCSIFMGSQNGLAETQKEPTDELWYL